ncbi:MAG: phosphotransferase, partial [Candidatus Xenobia bacterium]
FLQRLGCPYDAHRLHADFQALIRHLQEADGSWFVYRDFQSRNIMVRDGRLGFIDYQGGRQGALQYDLVSLLYQARAALPANARQRLIERWLDAAVEVLPLSRDIFRRYLPGFVLIRLLQTLGTYGKVGLGGHHAAFVSVIPTTLRMLREALRDPPVPLPTMADVLARTEDRFAVPEEAA